MTEHTQEELANAVKPAAFSDPHDHCIRCRDDGDAYDGFQVDWTSKGNAMAGEPPNVLGNICTECMAELLDEWGYPVGDDDR